jgi:hypothetical protein
MRYMLRPKFRIEFRILSAICFEFDWPALNTNIQYAPLKIVLHPPRNVKGLCGLRGSERATSKGYSMCELSYFNKTPQYNEWLVLYKRSYV